MYAVSGHINWKDKVWWNSHHLRLSAHLFRSFAHLFKSCGNNLPLYVICTLFQPTDIEKTRHGETATISGYLHTFSGHLHTFSGHVDIIYLFMSYVDHSRLQILKGHGMMKQPPFRAYVHFFWPCSHQFVILACALNLSKSIDKGFKCLWLWVLC